MVLISLQVRKTIRSRALFLCSFVFSLGGFLQLADIALGAATPHPRGGFLPALVVRTQESRVTHLLHVYACFRSTSFVHAGCGLEQVFIGTIHVRDAPEEEHLLMRRKTMMCRHKKKNDLEREENMHLVMI